MIEKPFQNISLVPFSFAVAFSAIYFSQIDSSLALVWPVNAFVVAAMVWKNVEWGIALNRLFFGMVGVAIANHYFFGIGSLGFAFANAAECIIAYYALLKIQQIVTRSPEPGHSLIYWIGAGMAGVLVSASIASASFFLLTGSVTAEFFLNWFMADLLGLTIFLPIFALMVDGGMTHSRREVSLGLVGVISGILIGLAMSTEFALLGILACVPIAFGLVSFFGLWSGLGYVLSLFAALVVSELYFAQSGVPLTVTGFAALDVQIIVSVVCIATLLSGLNLRTRRTMSAERDLALEKLNRTAERARALQEAIAQSPDAVVVFDRDDRLFEFNETYRNLYPRSADAIKRGERFEDILRAGLERGEYLNAIGREEEWLAERLELHTAPISESEQRLADGRWLLVRETQLEGGGRVGFRFDITARKRLESELKHETLRARAAVQAKDRFMATMSHELRTPMNGVLGMAQVLQSSDLDEEQREMAGIIVDSGSKLLRLLNDLLDFSRIEAGETAFEFAPFSPRDLVETQVKLFEPKAREKGLELFAAIDEDLPENLLGDEGRLAQILSNLLSNAVKFTERGAIKVFVRATAKDIGTTSLKISVSDSGAGVPEKERERIFSRFEQGHAGRAAGGAGLGLAIVKGICEAHGGTISCEPNPSAGSIFTAILELDNVARTMRQVSEAPSSEHQQAACGRLLIAEDNLSNQAVLRAMLKQTGMQIDYANNGLEACALFEKNPYDLVLMDSEMPDMDGLRAIKNIREFEAAAGNPPTRIVMCSANVMNEQIEESKSAGADGYLQKPIEQDELFDLIGHCTRNLKVA